MAEQAEILNADCHAGLLNQGKLEQALHGQGEEFCRLVTENCPHLFASASVFVSAAQIEKMRAVITAVEHVVALPAYGNTPDLIPRAKGVFFGYDFHLNEEGAHLIEINTNAGGALLNNLLLQSQREVVLPGDATAGENLEAVFLDMFRNEWRLERGEVPLQTVVVVDEQPEQQYLYPEFLLAQRMFERAGITALIAAPSELTVREDGLYCRERKIDLVYNRLTDFSLQHHPALRSIFQNNELAVITPHPCAYAAYADKYNLALFSDPESLRAMGASEADIEILKAGVPLTRKVQAADEDEWWLQRKQWFFKPSSGYGSKGTYRGANITKRVFAEIIMGDYVAQRMAKPAERAVGGADAALLKYDLRCYVYDGQVQLIVARLYQGQTTNFRTPNGGFAQVRIVG